MHYHCIRPLITSPKLINELVAYPFEQHIHIKLNFPSIYLYFYCVCFVCLSILNSTRPFRIESFFPINKLIRVE